MPAVLGLERLRQEDCCGFEASLDYIQDPIWKKKKQPNKQKHNPGLLIKVVNGTMENDQCLCDFQHVPRIVNKVDLFLGSPAKVHQARVHT